MGGNRKQRGSVVWIILLVLIGLVFGAWQYNQSRTTRRVQTQQAAEQKAQEQRKGAELKALEHRLAEEKQQNDALAVSRKAVDDVITRWEDATKVASTSSRIALSGPVGSLQGIRREAEQLTVSPCMDQAKTQLVQSMNRTIQGFLAFMRNELHLGDTFAQIEFEEAAKHMAAFKEGRGACPS